MSSGKITVVARIKARAGKEDQVMRELLALIPPTSREPGCISYDLHRALDDPGLFMFYENWCSREELDEHLGKPHLQEFLGKVDELLAEPVGITLWRMID
jgi:quinol monooxygenase YgiN